MIRGLTTSIVCLCLAIAAAPGGAVGLNSGRGATVIVLSSDAAPYQQAEAGIRRAREGAGEIRTLRVDGLAAESLKELEKSADDVVIAIGTPAAVKLHQSLGQGSRLLYCMVSDPERAGLTAGRRTPGVTVDVPVSEQVAVIKRALPGARTIGVLHRASSDRSRTNLEALRAAWGSEYIIAIDADKHKDVAAALHELIDAKPDIIWTFADASVYDSTCTKALLKESLEAKVPVFGFSLQFVRAGALIGVGVTPEDQAEQAARMAADLTGGKDVRAEPTGPRVRLGVNTAIGRRMGVRLPESFLRAVDETFGEE